jgi:hypothetical protein
MERVERRTLLAPQEKTFGRHAAYLEACKELSMLSPARQRRVFYGGAWYPVGSANPQKEPNREAVRDNTRPYGRIGFVAVSK